MLPPLPPTAQNPGLKLVQNAAATDPMRKMDLGPEWLAPASRPGDAPRPPKKFWRGLCLALLIMLPFWLLVGLLLWYGLSGADPGQGPGGAFSQ